MTVLRDNHGHSIAVGDHVAYNLSGTVALGWIEAYPRRRSFNQWGHYTGDPFIVQLEEDAAGFKAGHMSKVRNPHNLVVIPRG